jgi:hypothetical protein
MNTLNTLNTLIKEYRSIIDTPMKLEVKKELLTRLILQLDGLTFENVDLKQKRKEFIKKIQYILNILDNIKN